jgi:hypothetical protein
MIRATQAQTAHFILNKNYLAAVKAPQLLQLVKEMVGLPGEPPLIPFLAAYARLANFSPADLLTELYQNRRLIQSILMRSASYVVATEDFLTLHAATARQHNQDFNSEFRLWGLDNSEVEALEKPILEAIGDQPATAEAIIKRLPPSLVRELSQTSRGGRVSATNNVALILRWLAAKGSLVASQEMLVDPGAMQFEPSDSAQDRTASHLKVESLTYAPLPTWYPGLDLTTAPSEAEAQAALVQAYLAAFGPATEADISFWTGFGKSETARAVNALASKTTLTLVEGIPGMLLLLKEQAEALQATQPPSPPIVNILPDDDPFVTAHRASRARYFSDQKLQRHIFNSSGAAQPTIVVNGQIVGTWEWADHQLTWHLLAEVDPTFLPLIQAEIECVGAFIQPDLQVVQKTA